MMKPEVVKLEGKTRETGKKESADLRENLRIPSVLYGPNIKENIHFHVSELELERILSKSQTKLQELTVEGTTYNTLLKRVEFDPITDRPVHADFYVLEENRRVALRVPIRLKGIPVGVTDGGGRIFQPMRIVRVKVLPAVIPAQFEVDISHLNIGDSIHVSELDMEGITPLDDPSRTLVTISPPKSEDVFTTTAPVEEGELEELPEGEEELIEGEEGVEGAEEGGEEEEKE
ncbi:MAG: 50S ribosomal protein L25 [Balneolaceae bacterium]